MATVTDKKQRTQNLKQPIASQSLELLLDKELKQICGGSSDYSKQLGERTCDACGSTNLIYSTICEGAVLVKCVDCGYETIDYP